MPRTIHKTDNPVTLEGYQAVLKPSKFGYSLSAVIPQNIVDDLETEREDNVKWCLSKVKNPRRAVCKPEPWEEVSEGMYKVKFSWKEENRPPIYDMEGTQITDINTPLYSGSLVKLAFFQKPYILKDGETYGTSLKLVGVQVKALNGQAGVDTGDMSEADVAALFGTGEGFKQSDPNIVIPDGDEEDF